MRRLLFRGSTDAARAWLAIGVVLAVTLWSVARGAIGWSLFGVGLLAVLVLPTVAYRSAKCVPPSTAAVLAAAPFAVGVAAPWPLVVRVATFVAVAATALVIAIELDAFTRVELQRSVAVAFVVTTTMTVAGVWLLAQWAADYALGTALLESNEQVMWRLIAASVAGLAAGVVFDQYLDRLLPGSFVPRSVDSEDATDQVETTGETVTGLFSRVGMDEHRQRQLVRFVQGFLLAVALLGVVTISPDVVASAVVALIATKLPTFVADDEAIHHQPGLALWIAVAVGLHTIGTLAFYQTVWGWHKVTHSVSGSMIAIVGYIVIRTVETNSGTVSFPPKFTVLFVVLFAFSAGVCWEILEFTLDGVAAVAGAEDVFVTQYGLFDTMSDMVANTVGALVVAIGATVYRTR